MSISDGLTTLGFAPTAGAGFVTETITDPAFSNITTLNVSLLETDDFGEGAANFVVDNFQVIPEPTSLALLALGGLALMRRHRA